MTTKLNHKSALLLSTALLSMAIVVCNSATNVPDAANDSTIAFRELDPDGPDLAIDVDRLRQTVFIELDAEVHPGDVDEGCAAAQTGRDLLRFDVKSDNHGPADIFFGPIECISDKDGSCEAQHCSFEPSCCDEDEDYHCTSQFAEEDDRFEWHSAHGHIHFKSFARYRLLNPDDQSIVARGEKRSFCLMDTMAIDGSSCPAAERYTCSNQGIHAGCSDVYSANLSCNYIDITGVAEGNYTLEVLMDPLDEFQESDEVNNLGRIPVTVNRTGITPAVVCDNDNLVCRTQPQPLPDNVDITTTWDPCEGDGFEWTASIDFEENFDRLVIDGTSFDGRNRTISGTATGALTLEVHTDHSVASGGITEIRTPGCVHDDGGESGHTCEDVQESAVDVPRGIPDNLADGNLSQIFLSSDERVETIALSLTIEHPDRGDLTVSLESPSGEIVVVHDRTDAGQSGLTLEQLDLSSTFEGGTIDGIWRLKAVDGQEGNIGNIVDFSLEIHPACH